MVTPLSSPKSPPVRGRRGDASRSALIAAGVTLFGEYGMEGASTRMLARQAQVNISAISYYFDSKEGLYEAVIRHIAEGLRERTLPLWENARQILHVSQPEALTRERALYGIQCMLTDFAQLFVGSPDLQVWIKVVVREQIDPTPAFDILYQNCMKAQIDLLAQLVAVCTGLEPASTEVRLRGHALLGQVIAFFIARGGILRSLGVPTLEESHVTLIKSIVWGNIQACLSPADNPTLPGAESKQSGGRQ